ncbi:MAG TPA: helix-turn-helix transcriptional regulator, partial [Pseudomonadales bacterium]|nr:helix-turn-helix transcriptional regulator [Pseudomonadales bacterium]
VHAEMVLGPSGYPSQEQLADKLHMSTRTFRRRLYEKNISYKQVLEDTRRRDAMQLLEKKTLEIQKVAELLGYKNPANFTRAFREWTGRSPSQYRFLRQTSQHAEQLEPS